MVTLLTAAVVVLIAIVIFQIARANELLSVLKDEKEGEVTADTNRTLSYFFLAFLVIGLGGAFWSVAIYHPKFLPSAASIHGVEIDKMFNLTLFFTGIVFILTQILLFWFAFRYRGGKDRKAYFFPHNNKLEMIWTTVPAIVMTVLVIFGMKSWFRITGPAPKDTVEVEAVGEQFQWNIRYSGADGKLGKRKFDLITPDNPLGIDWTDERSHDDFMANDIHLPVNKPVLFRLGAKDVLHSFYLPYFRVKMDCVPGIPTQFWFTPTQTSEEKRTETGDNDFQYVLACAELCGQGHWSMKKDVYVETDEEYQKWFAQQKPMYETVKISLQTKTTDNQNTSLDNNGQKEEGKHPISER